MAWVQLHYWATPLVTCHLLPLSYSWTGSTLASHPPEPQAQTQAEWLSCLFPIPFCLKKACTLGFDMDNSESQQLF